MMTSLFPRRGTIRPLLARMAATSLCLVFVSVACAQVPGRLVSAGTTASSISRTTCSVSVTDGDADVLVDVTVAELPDVDDQTSLSEIPAAAETVVRQNANVGVVSLPRAEREHDGVGTDSETEPSGSSPHVYGSGTDPAVETRSSWWGRHPSGDGVSIGTEDIVLPNAFVFVNGDAISSPCKVTMEDDQLCFNGQRVSSSITDFEELARAMLLDGETSRKVTQADVVGMYMADSVIVAIDGQPLVNLPRSQTGLRLLQAVLNPERDYEQVDQFLSVLPPECDVDVFAEWIHSVQISTEFEIRADSYVQLVAKVGRDNKAAADANRRLHKMAYPLTIAGMLMTVLACGHLLSHRPDPNDPADPIDASPLKMKLVIQSAGIVFALSALDLVWTMLATSANQMSELNPVGSALLKDPVMLVLFKVSATGLAIGLIVCLRQYRRAQQASWWACLIMTLLTVRWLTFNSLFVS